MNGDEQVNPSWSRRVQDAKHTLLSGRAQSGRKSRVFVFYFSLQPFPLFARQTHWVVIKMGEP